jgi:hypothetical protein
MVLGGVFGALALVTACDSAESTAGSSPAEACTVTQVENGALMECPDGTNALITNGLAGENGLAGSTGTNGDPGVDGLNGADGNGCTVLDADDHWVIQCEDGTEATLPKTADDPIDEPTDPGIEDPTNPEGADEDKDFNSADPFIQEELSDAELAKVDILRSAIDQGLNLGKNNYLETVSLELQNADVLDNYEDQVSDEDVSGADLEVALCPFVDALSNGWTPTGIECDKMLDLAKIEVTAELQNLMDDEPLPQEIGGSEHAEEASFWYEQGAVSGVEQHRVLVRSDLTVQVACNPDPTPAESSYEKGLVVGMQSLAASFNSWLAANGYTADYPTMSNPIQVCNTNASLLDPARQDAKNNTGETHIDNPLCPGYSPATDQLALEYANADIEYKKGIDDGIENEFALAAVKIFKVVPCNVGDPIVLDLDGDGIEINPIYRGVNFDFYGVGQKQAVAWPSGDDGFLALDRNQNGMIDNGYELFGNVDLGYADGFTHLAELDSNADGAITAADAAFNLLVVWQDANSDGISQSAEMRSLTDVGITSMPTEGSQVSMRSQGTRIPMAAEAVTSTGAMLMGDAYLQTAPYASPSL